MKIQIDSVIYEGTAVEILNSLREVHAGTV